VQKIKKLRIILRDLLSDNISTENIIKVCEKLASQIKEKSDKVERSFFLNC